jgi:hypothetical protein
MVYNGSAPPTKSGERIRNQLRKSPLAWRERALGMVATILCPECRHDTNFHFYEAAYPDFGFCQVEDCQCTCDWFKEVDGLNG